MDYLLVLLAISGVVVAGVMLLLASRATRMQRESDARVDELQSLATGSVLFAAAAPAELEFAPVERAPLATDVFAELALTPAEPVATEFAPGAVANDAFAAFSDEFTDEAPALRHARVFEEAPEELIEDAPRDPAPETFEMPARAYPFVMTVSTGNGGIFGSFDRTTHRSRT